MYTNACARFCMAAPQAGVSLRELVCAGLHDRKKAMGSPHHCEGTAFKVHIAYALTYLPVLYNVLALFKKMAQPESSRGPPVMFCIHNYARTRAHTHMSVCVYVHTCMCLPLATGQTSKQASKQKQAKASKSKQKQAKASKSKQKQAKASKGKQRQAKASKGKQRQAKASKSKQKQAKASKSKQKQCKEIYRKANQTNQTNQPNLSTKPPTQQPSKHANKQANKNKANKRSNHRANQNKTFKTNDQTIRQTQKQTNKSANKQASKQTSKHKQTNNKQMHKRTNKRKKETNKPTNKQQNQTKPNQSSVKQSQTKQNIIKHNKHTRKPNNPGNEEKDKTNHHQTPNPGPFKSTIPPTNMAPVGTWNMNFLLKGPRLSVAMLVGGRVSHIVFSSLRGTAGRVRQLHLQLLLGAQTARGGVHVGIKGQQGAALLDLRRFSVAFAFCSPAKSLGLVENSLVGK